MRKRIWTWILFSFLLIGIPLIGKAAPSEVQIKNISLAGPTQATVNQDFSLSFSMSFSGLKKGTNDTLGVYAVAFHLDIDDSIVSVTSASSNSNTWDTELYKGDGKYYILSTVSDTNYERNKCIDDFSYCADYIISIHFLVKDTEKESISIGMDESKVLLLPMLTEVENYSEEELLDMVKTVEYAPKKTQTIRVLKAQSPTPTPSPSATPSTEQSPSQEEPKDKPTVAEKEEKSNNNYLKSLEIENYKIDFKKEKKKYSITVEEEVNQVQVTATPEDEKATYKILGAEDIRGNDKKIEIVVTAENGETTNYIIEVKNTKNDLEENETIVKTKKEDKKKTWKPTEKEKQAILIGGSAIAIILLIVFIINFRGNRKIDKALDQM